MRDVNFVSDNALSRRTFLNAGLLAGASCLLSASSLFAANKPSSNAIGPASWATFRRTADLAGVASSPLPTKLKQKWKITSKDGFASTAAIVGDHVYIGALCGEMLCLEREIS